MENPPFTLGDIVKWPSLYEEADSGPTYSYGMVIKEPEFIQGGEYKYESPLEKRSRMTFIEPIMAVTVYSFKDQRVRTIYQNTDELPSEIQKVTFLPSDP